MMGTQVEPAQLFWEFRLKDHVPTEHMLRRIDRFLDLESVRPDLRPFYSTIGRPSIDSELMTPLLMMVGYRMGIRSERRLFDEVHLHLAYRWFRRLGLDGTRPSRAMGTDGSVPSDALRHLFESVVARCQREGLVGGEGPEH